MPWDICHKPTNHSLSWGWKSLKHIDHCQNHIQNWNELHFQKRKNEHDENFPNFSCWYCCTYCYFSNFSNCTTNFHQSSKSFTKFSKFRETLTNLKMINLILSLPSVNSLPITRERFLHTHICTISRMDIISLLIGFSIGFFAAVALKTFFSCCKQRCCNDNQEMYWLYSKWTKISQRQHLLNILKFYWRSPCHHRLSTTLI